MSTPQLLVITSPSTRPCRYTLLVAQDEHEVRAAQRLRHRVFAGELGATLRSSQPGLDIDEFDMQ
ncbi:MAG: GNAT family N-acyltransferase [Pseudonocardiaceae bacterium]